MNKKNLVTVIVPVYNVENYLRKCLNSIISQSYTNLEVLLIDDGSTDTSGKLCDEYAVIDSRIRVFHKVNGGLSSARNMGLDNMTGEYIIFIDSDDYFAEDAIGDLVKAIVKYQADLSFGEVRMVDETGATICERGKKTYKETILTSKQTMTEICLNRLTGVSACGKLYKASLFENIRYPVGRLYEDAYTTPEIVLRSQKAVFINRTIIFWVQRSNSIMHRKVTEEDFIVFNTLENLIKLVDSNYPALHNDAVVRLVNDTFWTIMMRLVYNDDYLLRARKIRKRYRKYWVSALKHPGLSYGKKIQVLIALINLRLYRRIRLMKNKRQ